MTRHDTTRRDTTQEHKTRRDETRREEEEEEEEERTHLADSLGTKERLISRMQLHFPCGSQNPNSNLFIYF